MEKRLQDFLEKNSLGLVEKISKGYSSEVFLVKNPKGEKLALKIEKDKSPRVNLVKKEVENLRLANSVGIGPKLIGFDEKNRIVLMEFVDGKRFVDFVSAEPSKKELQRVIDELYKQAEKLDEIGLDHGQLGGGGKNILVSKDRAVIIDFEKASQNRRVHNKTVLDAVFERNKDSELTRKIKEILENKN